MSNAKRPALERKHTRTTEKKRDGELDQGVRITLDGEVFEVRNGDLTAMDTRELRRQVGYSFGRLQEYLGDDPDIDVLAALIWLARRIKGERTLTFEEVALEIGYDALDVMEMDNLAEPEEIDPTDPEA